MRPLSITRSDRHREFLLAVLAQIGQGAAPAGIALCVHHATGSLTDAGVATAVFAVGSGLSRPAQGRLVARIGLRPTLSLCAVLHGVGLVLVIASSELREPIGVTAAAAALGGIGLPPISMALRLAWVPQSGTGRSRAYGLVTLSQELSILLGPALLGLCSVALSPPYALAVIVCVAAVGTGLFVGSPSIRNGHSHPHKQALGLSIPGPLRRLIATRFVLGVAIGVLQLSLVALAIRAGHPAMSTALIAAMSGGGIVGALVYGRRSTAAGVARRHTRRLTLAMAAALLVLALVATRPGVDEIVVAFALAVAVGGLLNPTLTTIYLVADSVVDRATAGEAFGWMSTGLFAGTAAGNALTGPSVALLGLPGAFGLAAAAAASVALLCVSRRVGGVPSRSTRRETRGARLHDDRGVV